MNNIVIHNLSPEEAVNNLTDKYISVGLHPWHIKTNWQEQFYLTEQCASQERVLMIGEAGLDKVCRTGFTLQQEIFRRQALLAETVRKPLIIHCVKAMQEVLAFHKEIHPSSPWIIHGFHGKPEQAREFLLHGFYLSFGEKFNQESLIITPLERLCTETDESSIPIESIYWKIAKTKNISIEELQRKANRVIEVVNRETDFTYIDIHTH